MYIFLIVIHILACLVLISVILLHAGRGGGLTEAAGGETAQSVFGTQAPDILKKATTISAIAFLCTSLLLGMITARRGKSLFDQNSLKQLVQTRTAVPAKDGGVESKAIPADVPATADTSAVPAE